MDGWGPRDGVEGEDEILEGGSFGCRLRPDYEIPAQRWKKRDNLGGMRRGMVGYEDGGGSGERGEGGKLRPRNGKRSL